MSMQEDKIRDLEQEAKDLERKHEQKLRAAIQLQSEMKTIEGRARVVAHTLRIMRSRAA